MSEIDSIALAIDEEKFSFASATRHESLGDRVIWNLGASDRNLPSYLASLPLEADSRRTLIQGPLQISVRNAGVFAVKGPFRLVSCPDSDPVALSLEATVEDFDAIRPESSVCLLRGGQLSRWLQNASVGKVLASLDPKLQEELDGLWGADGLVLQRAESALCMASWLAWAATRLAEKNAGEAVRPFWILGGAGCRWRLVRDTTQNTVEADNNWRGEVIPSATLDNRFVEIGGIVRRYTFSRKLTGDDLRIELSQSFSFLPKRISLGGQHLFVVRRSDVFGTGAAPWRVQLTAAEKLPEPRWDRPQRASFDAIVREKWASGEFLSCSIEGISGTFPVRLTSFDAGGDSTEGWQWVPTVGNRIKCDFDWMPTSIPDFAYAKRERAASEPYTFQVGSNSQWLARFGRVAIQFVKEGLRIG